MAESIVTLRVETSQATRALRNVQNQSGQLKNAFGGLKSAIAGVGLTVLARQAINTSANFQKLNVRLGLLTKASGTFARSQELAAEAQKAFGLSATEALDGITNITARLQPLGVGVEDIKTTFFGFNTAAKLAGASTIEASNAFRQLAQALGSGRLQGDEFRSIAEQVPTLLAPIAKELGTTVGGLKKFASEGKLTSDVVIRALKQVEKDGAKSLQALLKNDPTQVFKNLSNEAENLSRAFGDALAPAVLPVIRAITRLTEEVTKFINSGIGKVSLIFTAIAAAIKSITVIAPLLIGQVATLTTQFQVAAFNSALASTGLKGVAASSFVAAGGITKLNLALAGLKLALIKTGLGAAIVLVGTLAAKFLDNKSAVEANSKAAEEFNNNLKGIKETAENSALALNELAISSKEFEMAALGGGRSAEATKKRLERELEILKDRNKILKGEEARDAEMDKNKLFNDTLITQLKSIDALEKQLSGKKEEITLQDKINDLKNKFGDMDIKQLIEMLKKEDALKKQVEAMEKQKKAAEELKKKFQEIGEEIERSLKDNFREAITGAQSFGDAVTNVLNKIRDKLIDLVLDKAFDGLAEKFAGVANAVSGQGGGGSQGGGGGGGGTKFGTLIGGAIGGPIGGAIGSLLPFAEGGNPPVGKPSIVGEKGPELFIPRTAGTIIPNNNMGGNVVVNVSVDASGSSITGDDDKGNQFGKDLAVVIQQEIIRQKRSGGLLA